VWGKVLAPEFILGVQTMKWLKANDYKVMPWKNGGGKTREIALAADGEGGFDWRLSIATISQSGPFSSFPGIDRSIALMDGDAVVLEFENGEHITLDKNTEPYVFDGGVSVYARCMGSETTDLNMMTRGGRFRHRMRRLIIERATLVENIAEWTFVVFANSAVITADHKTFVVNPYDTLKLSGQQKLLVAPEKKRVTFFMITLERYIPH